MNIVITMAGMGSRFRKAGYKVPKYMIDAHGKSLFEWSMLSLAGYNDRASKYIFVTRSEDNCREFIIKECKKVEILNFEIMEIDYLTDGQATTCILSSEYWDMDKELLVYNIDTFVESNVMHRDELRGNGFIPCFKGEGEHWSFVKLSEDGSATEVKEKQRISEYCTLGAYYFETGRLYKELYEEYYSKKESIEQGEKYIAPLYNYLIKKGGKVYISDVPLDKVHVLGTPEELQVFLDTYKV